MISGLQILASLSFPQAHVAWLLLAALALVVWVWMVVDCSQAERAEKAAWTRRILLGGPFGAVLYLLVRKAPRRKGRHEHVASTVLRIFVTGVWGVLLWVVPVLLDDGENTAALTLLALPLVCILSYLGWLPGTRTKDDAVRGPATEARLEAERLQKGLQLRRCTCGGVMTPLSVAVTAQVLAHDVQVGGWRGPITAGRWQGHTARFHCETCGREVSIHLRPFSSGILGLGLLSLIPLSQPSQFSALGLCAYLLLPAGCLCVFFTLLNKRRRFPEIPSTDTQLDGKELGL
jgi:hypothetical protein